MSKTFFSPQVEIIMESGSQIKVGECERCRKVTQDSMDIEFIEVNGLCTSCLSRAEGFDLAFLI